jgi:outer membrane protein OmpA-like peptidoglycan-associated protein
MPALGSCLKFLAFCTLIQISNFAKAQLRVDFNSSPKDLVQKTLLGNKAHMRISNIKYQGQTRALGKYNTLAAHIDLGDGIILSTGDISGAVGPNLRGNAGEFFHMPGLPALTQLANNVTHDAALLQFEFMADYDEIRFKYVFASEEYPEFVGKGVNDVFAFWLTDLETENTQNLALIPGTQLPVTVDHINAQTNAHLYIANARWNSHDVMQWENDRKRGEYAYMLQYDGLTHWLEARASIVPARRYRLTMAIADAGDGLFDSAVMLKAGSFVSAPKGDSIKPVSGLIIAFKGMNYKISGDTFRMAALLHFAHDASETQHPDDVALLNKIARVMQEYPQIKLMISGHTDNSGTPEYNLKLSRARAEFVYRQLILKETDAQRMSHSGWGDTQPHTQNDTEAGKALNRRVEFGFVGF